MAGTTQIWNRLEPRPRTNSFKRAIKAEIRDPLWMLSRQWQMGELNAEDTGTAAFARLDMQTSRINRIAKKNDAYVGLADTMPLECMVEREEIEPDLLQRLELGRVFLKFLKTRLASDAGLSGAALDTAIDDVRGTLQFQFAKPTVPSSNKVDHPQFYSTPELEQATMTLENGRGLDGYKLVKLAGSLSSSITFTNSNAARIAALNNAQVDLQQWYASVYSQPSTGSTEDYWLQNHLEYQFACSAPRTGSGYTVLSAREYYQGHLDWYSFNIKDQDPNFATLVNGQPNREVIESKPFTVIPSKISFGGMPAPRYWEMENRRIDIGNMRASTTDTATLLVSEFAMIYSNDWTLLPYTVPTGSILNLRKVLVTDVFGQVTHVSAGAEANWNMFNNKVEGATTIDARLFVPPVVQNMEESEPIESVTFMRDEMSNMVWAIENTIKDGVSKAQKGKEAGQRLVALLETEVGVNTPTNTVTNSAEIKYNLMNKMPEHWIPYIPVNRGVQTGLPAVQLQRASMPRQIHNNAPEGRIRPRTELLKGGSTISGNTWSASYIHEEEVPRSGAILTTTWQRARWHKGKVALWLGRRKQNGRGEANSGLKFDNLTDK